LQQKPNQKGKGLLLGILMGFFLVLAFGATACIPHSPSTEQPTAIESESPSQAFAVDKSTIVHLEKVEGLVSVSSILGKQLSVLEGMQLFNGHTIATELESYAYLGLDRSRAAKLDTLSSLDIQLSGTDLELILGKGNLFFNIATPLDADETLSITTSTMVIGVRGTSGIVHAEANGVPQGILVLDGSISLKLEGTEYRVSAKSKAELIRIDGSVTIQISEINETDIDAFAVDEIAKDIELQDRLRESGWDIEEILHPTSSIRLEKKADYLRIIEKNRREEEFGLDLLSGGLLDFDDDDLADLVLIYGDEYGEYQLCAVHMNSGHLMLQQLDMGADFGFTDITGNGPKGAILYNYYPDLSYAALYMDSVTGEYVYDNDVLDKVSQAPSPYSFDYRTYQGDGLKTKLSYILEPIVKDGFDDLIFQHVRWSISRDGEEVASGTVPDYTYSIPEIDAIQVEAEETFGTRYTGMPIEELIELLMAED
jgi:hypothetical protein